jgi:beta-N-acetylhexosaminidase
MILSILQIRGLPQLLIFPQSRFVHILRSITLSVFLVITLSSWAQFIPNFPSISPPGQLVNDIPERVELVIESLTLRQKVSQLFFVRAFGEPWTETQASYKKLRKLVETDQVGGVIFFKGKAVDQVRLANHLQELASIPLLMAQDMEFGAAMRVDEATRIIPAMGVAATGNPKNAWLMGWITAVEAKALGVHQVYAPVVDVNNNPSNPVINVRSFSESPSIVSLFANEFIKGVQSTGLLATAKHFPGHGDTENDSHFTLPVIRHDYARLDTVELPPFREAIQAGIASIMSAHISFPNLSDKPLIPGTLDPNVLGRLLVDSLHYDGLIVSDALEMRGVTSVFKPGEAAVAAINAGVDLIILSPNEDLAIEAVLKAVQDSTISEARIDASLRKLLHWKFQLGLFENKTSDLDYMTTIVGHRDHRVISERIARESITLLRNEKNILPLAPTKHKRIVLIGVANDRSGTTGKALADEMAKYHPSVQFMSLNPRTTAAQQQAILQAARAADVTIVATYYTVVAGELTSTPGPRERFLKQIQDVSKPSVVLALGNPYTMSIMPKAEAHVVAWSGHEQHVSSIAAALFGASDISGRIPVTIPELYAIGSGLDLKRHRIRSDLPESVFMVPDSIAKIDDIMTQAIAERVFPGGVVAVVKDGVIIHHKAYGRHTYELDARPYKVDDIFDLASLTKVIATTTAVMRLVDQGKLSINDRVSKYVREFDTDEKRSITIKQLLTHESGWPAFKVYVDKLKTRSAILDAILNEPLINRPSTQYVYSDLGFITLAHIVEKVSSMPFETYITKELFEPLGMNTTRYNPLQKDPLLIDRIPPTEIDTIYRKMTVKGHVHDERAWYMDGIAGHAGLFSTAGDIATWATMLLQQGHYGGYTLSSSETVNIFTARQSVLAKRGLGFDMKSDSGFSSAGALMSASTFGHTGFTGTSVWMDPERDMAIIVLTNRTWPYRGTSGPIGRVRASIADAVVQSIKK